MPEIPLSVTTEDITAVINQAKELLIEKMVREDIINEATANKINQHAIVVSRKGYWGKLWDGIFKKEEKTNFVMTIVKILG